MADVTEDTFHGGNDAAVAATAAPESMDELKRRHRRELKQLQGTLTSLKKQAQADKKRKKALLGEIADREAELAARHAREADELAALLAQASLQQERAGGDAAAAAGEPPAAQVMEGMAEPAGEPSAAAAAKDEVAGKQKKPNRQQLRKQRKEAQLEEMQRQARQEAAQMPNHEKDEADKLRALLKDHGLRVHSIPPDGHCLFNALSHQLAIQGDGAGDAGVPSGAMLRSIAAQHIRKNAGAFMPFMVNEETGDQMSRDDLKSYLEQLEKTALWGGHIEIRALSEALNHPIHVFQPTGTEPLIVSSEEGGAGAGAHPLRVSYHRHQYGLGEHYNSLVPVDPAAPGEP